MRRGALGTAIAGLLVAALCLLCAMEQTGAARAMVLRVDVQNAPRGLEASMASPFMLRLDAKREELTVAELKAQIRARFARDTCASDQQHALEFDIEVYNARMGGFERLTHASQLGKRAQLNVVLHRDDDEHAPVTFPALPSRLFGVDTSQGEFRINGCAVVVAEIENTGLGTGLTTWDGSVVLAKYLEHQMTSELQGKRVIEVGAGTGIVGIAAALLGARQVVLTDLPYTMENLASNVARTLERSPHVKTDISTQVLDWLEPRDDLGDIDWIVAADVVWIEVLIPPLVRTLHTLVHASRVPTRILMAHQQRSVASDELLFRELQAHGLARHAIPPEMLHPSFVSERIQIWELSVT